MTPLRVLALSTVPAEGPSARFRVYQYIPALREAGIEMTVAPFYQPDLFTILYRSGRHARKASLLLRQLVRRLALLRRVPNVDVYLVHREVLPVGPPVVELTLARQQGRSLVYDFDDAIYLPNVSEANRFVRGLKWPSKVPRIIGAADRVIAGNGYLARYAGIRNPRVTVIPTAVDTTRFVPRAGEGPTGSRPVLGWIGSPTTVRYMSELREILASLAARFSFTVRVAGGGRAIAFPGVAIDNVAWTPATEVSLFNTCDIGIYPLTDDAWTRGKCGFKAIQFMACGVPVIASAVGVNREIIQDGVTGFLASTETEWTEKLGWLLADPRLREKLGHAGRCAVEERYSLARHAPALAAVLRDSAGVRR